MAETLRQVSVCYASADRIVVMVTATLSTLVSSGSQSGSASCGATRSVCAPMGFENPGVGPDLVEHPHDEWTEAIPPGGPYDSGSGRGATGSGAGRPAKAAATRSAC